jgi:hypothetical protein
VRRKSPWGWLAPLPNADVSARAAREASSLREKQTDEKQTDEKRTDKNQTELKQTEVNQTDEEQTDQEQTDVRQTRRVISASG